MIQVGVVVAHVPMICGWKQQGLRDNPRSPAGRVVNALARVRKPVLNQEAENSRRNGPFTMTNE
jgi:hypothetical protein